VLVVNPGEMCLLSIVINANALLRSYTAISN